MPEKIIIGSRGSELAMWQANHVLGKLKRIGLEAEIRIIRTKGDRDQHLSWDKIEGKGFFTREIEDALLSKEIDLAVHSHKDLPTEEVKGLVIAAVSEREDPSELLLVNKSAVDDKQKFCLKANAVVGTSSARRKSQLLAWRGDLKLEDLRGNVPTRIRKLRDNKYDAILIAYAGVARLGIDLEEFHAEKLPPREFIPAPAQGVLALQVRKNDHELFEKLQEINVKEVQETIAIERKVMNLFQGGCQLPLGVYCEKEDEEGKDVYRVRVAKAERWDSFPQYFYFETRKPGGLAERMVEKIKNVCRSTVFISRDEKRNDFFKKCLEANGCRVFAQALIDTRPIPIRKTVKTDWIFFSSKNAVRYFFEQKPETNGVRFGAVSRSTADEIRKFGKRPEFIGSPDDTRLTGKKFASLVGRQTVLFPQAKGSMRTVQQQLKKEQVVDLVVYETSKKISGQQFPVPGCDVLVFTSPSNVEAFFEKNKISAAQKVIAMGDATANVLRKFGVKSNKQPASFDDLGLVQAVMSL